MTGGWMPLGWGRCFMGNDRRRFSRLAPCQDGCRLANAGYLVLSNPVSLTATVCVQYSSPAKPAGSAGSQHGLDGFGQQGFAARLERFRQALAQRRFALERTGRDAQGFEALGGEW